MTDDSDDPSQACTAGSAQWEVPFSPRPTPTQ